MFIDFYRLKRSILLYNLKSTLEVITKTKLSVFTHCIPTALDVLTLYKNWHITHDGKLATEKELFL